MMSVHCSYSLHCSCSILVKFFALVLFLVNFAVADRQICGTIIYALVTMVILLHHLDLFTSCDIIYTTIADLLHKHTQSL